MVFGYGQEGSMGERAGIVISNSQNGHHGGLDAAVRSTRKYIDFSTRGVFALKC